MLKLSQTLIFLFITACQSNALMVNKSDALWNIISQQCLPNQKQNQNPAPCEEVSFVKDSEQGYVVLKDRRGILQYLLMPTAKIGGMESSEILTSNSPNYFYESWRARSYMVKKNGAPIDDENISLAINSQLGRTQNQLHIHISCTRADVKELVHKNFKGLDKTWKVFPGGILGHSYWAKKIDESELKEKNIFSLVANEILNAKDNMNQFGIAMMAVRNGKKTEFVVLTDRAHLPDLDRASVEEIQDHDCALVIKK